MDYEKLYKEALGRAKSKLTNEVASDIFPELRESEDERILNGLIAAMKDQISCGGESYFGMPLKGILAYLEKQKEIGVQWSPSESEMGVLYKLCYISNQITDEDDTELTRLYQDLKREYFDGHSFENMFSNKKQKETLHISETCKENADSFTDDDERIRKALIEFLREAYSSGYAPEECAKWLVWLDWQKVKKPVYEDEFQKMLADSYKSGKNEVIDNPEKYGLQKPAEWSEEDEKMLASFLHKVEVCDLLSNKENVWIVKRLKSLHPQLIQKEAYKDGFQAARHAIALAFMEYCDKMRPNGKMCLSNGECEEIEKAFLIGDWEKIERYLRKYHWIETNQEQLGARLKQFPEGAEVEILIEAKKED